uniref:Putative secreted protein n=1 Tax=Amblyomma cajennense TaxID=34607 RepID=A0A023FCV9_AMBCJ
MKLAGPLVFSCLLAVSCGAAFRTHLDNDNEDDKTSEYRQWGQFPWEQPGNPPPIFPPDDFLMPRTGRWRSLKRPSDDPSRPWRDILKEYQRDNTDEYRIWGKFPWERPGNPPPFVPPSDTLALSQIGRFWNQDYLAGKPERPARYSSQDGDGKFNNLCNASFSSGSHNKKKVAQLWQQTQRIEKPAEVSVNKDT